MDLKEERHMILDMVSDGKISVEEAKRLLDALEQSGHDKRSARRRRRRRTVEIPIPPPMPDIQKIVRSSLRPMAPYMEMAYEDLEEELDEQREKMKAQQEGMQEELERMREELRVAHEELRRELGDVEDE